MSRMTESSELQGGCFQSRSLTVTLRRGRGTLVVEYIEGDECLSPLCALEIPSKFMCVARHNDFDTSFQM